MKHVTRILTLAALAVVGAPIAAQAANIQGPRRSALDKLKETSAVRERLILRGGRFELTPTLGFTMNDAFKRNVMFGAHLGYHITDRWEIGATGFYGTSFNTGLADEIESQRAEKAKTGAFSSVQLLASLELQYTPLYGKYALFGRTVLNYDIHLIVGGAAAKVVADRDIDEFNPGGVVGIGLRTFVTRGISVNVEVRDYIYASSLNSVKAIDADEAEAKSELRNNFAVTVGAGFYFPQEPDVSP